MQKPIRFRFLMLTVSCVLLVFTIGCATPTEHAQTPKDESTSKSDSSNFTQLTEDNISDVVGKRLVTSDGNFILLSEDGLISGYWGGSSVVGQWEMRDGLWCRSYSAFFAPSFVGVNACHLWEGNDENIRATRDRGKGSKYYFSINN